MDTIVSNYYVVDNEIIESNTINSEFDCSKYLLYEVLRTTNGIIVFLEDHLERLKNALTKLGLQDLYKEEDAKENLEILLHANRNQEGNIKFLCKQYYSKLQYVSYYIKHSYPNEKTYREGVNLSTFKIERIDPEIKQIKTNDYINQELKGTSALNSTYEVLLINKQGLITEGSRSNFFLVRGDRIYTAPENLILPGITRKFVLQAAANLNIEVIKKEHKLENVMNFEAAFLSGTSPKVLPVKQIDNFKFRTNHPVVEMIRYKFNEIYNCYISSRL